MDLRRKEQNIRSGLELWPPELAFPRLSFNGVPEFQSSIYAALFVKPVIMRIPLVIRIGDLDLECAEKPWYHLVHLAE